MKFPALKATSVLSLVVIVVVAATFGQGLLHRGQYRAAPGAQADPPSAFTEGSPNLVGAMFYSAWCSACALLDPKLRDVAPEFDGRAVEFVKFDFSMGPTEELQQRAAALDIVDTYEQNKGATGFMLLVDRRTDEAVSMITSSMSKDEIRAELDSTIAALANEDATAS